ncbi:hypothetical protein ACFX2G_026131 [Malus domestica]
MGRGFIYEAVDPFTHQVKLCDPGSAKVPVKGDEKISYICSHYYRSPGLIFGAAEYMQHPSISGQTVVSLLSSCARLSAHLAPLLPGGDAADHLIEIMKNAGSWQSN